MLYCVLFNFTSVLIFTGARFTSHWFSVLGDLDV